jgi:hypothetical protein
LASNAAHLSRPAMTRLVRVRLLSAWNCGGIWTSQRTGRGDWRREGTCRADAAAT